MGGASIIIPEPIMQKVMHWVHKADFEVSGFGTVLCENGVFTVQDAWLLKQVGTGATTDIDAQALSELMHDTCRLPGELNWWWHSHVNMAAFWSGTDTKTICDMASHGYCVATVFNKRRELKSAYAATANLYPLGNQVVLYDNITTTIGSSIDQRLIAEWDKDFLTNVQKVKSPMMYTGPRFRDFDEAFVQSSDDRILAREAKALGMKLKAYKKIILGTDTGKIKELEKKLDAYYNDQTTQTLLSQTSNYNKEDMYNGAII